MRRSDAHVPRRSAWNSSKPRIGTAGTQATHRSRLCSAAYIMQFVLQRALLANGYLHPAGQPTSACCRICRLEQAPSEAAYCRFKKKLTDLCGCHRECMPSLGLFQECGAEIEHLRDDGTVPARRCRRWDTRWLMDSTDVEAWARHGRTSRKNRREDTVQGPRCCVGTPDCQALAVHESQLRQARQPQRQQGAGPATPIPATARTKDEMYFGYKVNVVIVDANWGLPLFAATRPANASDVTVLIQDINDLLALYRTLSPRYLVC